jgi:hypothetical protein
MRRVEPSLNLCSDRKSGKNSQSCELATQSVRGRSAGRVRTKDGPTPKLGVGWQKAKTRLSAGWRKTCSHFLFRVQLLSTEAVTLGGAVTFSNTESVFISTAATSSDCQRSCSTNNAIVSYSN